jgi:hypothetical protein
MQHVVCSHSAIVSVMGMCILAAAGYNTTFEDDEVDTFFNYVNQTRL